MPITHRIAAALLATTAFSPLLALAMEIQAFDKMADADQGEYVYALVAGAQRVLIADGKRDLAEKVHQLFTTKLGDDKIVIGVGEFEKNLARVRLLDSERVAKDANVPRLEVEHAMIVTLQKNGIVLPKSFMTVASDFKPKVPSQKK